MQKVNGMVHGVVPENIHSRLCSSSGSIELEAPLKLVGEGVSAPSPRVLLLGR